MKNNNIAKQIPNINIMNAPPTVSIVIESFKFLLLCSHGGHHLSFNLSNIFAFLSSNILEKKKTIS